MWCAIWTFGENGRLGVGFVTEHPEQFQNDEWMEEQQAVDMRIWECNSKELAEAFLEAVALGWNNAVDYYESGAAEQEDKELKEYFTTVSGGIDDVLL